MPADPLNVTALLMAWSAGDRSALDRLLPLIYGELHSMAKRYMDRQGQGNTLQTTALIHEAYLKLLGNPDKQWANRSHFFAVAAQAMRHVLVDYARSRNVEKRGGGAHLVALEDAAIVSCERAEEIVALDDALQALAEFDPRKAQVVELRYFGGLSLEEAAEVLGVSAETVKRDFRLAKAWLHKELSRP
ncbi:MAG: sigma-70 family RNA polymerase sigma factor [Blastocatellia bacterium]|nr:sigma-70 family RNA polymerase sigma factor [Blastocatellia bacterium]